MKLQFDTNIQGFAQFGSWTLSHNRISLRETQKSHTSSMVIAYRREKIDYGQGQLYRQITSLFAGKLVP